MTDGGYTKLFACILDSTIWRENDKTRLVWITMLAMANKFGEVAAAIPGLADRARVSIADCEAALSVLLSPDTYSRTKEHDGRRIEVIDGGWKILNHALYRERMSAEDRRTYHREYWRENRSTQQKLNTPQQNSTDSTQSESESEPKAEARGVPVPPDSRNGFQKPKARWQIQKDLKAVEARIVELRREGGQEKNEMNRWVGPLDLETRAKVNKLAAERKQLKEEFDNSTI